MVDPQIRNLREEDYPYLRSVVNSWWAGRPIADLMPRFLFQHFQTTCFAAEEPGEPPRVVGFLIGFVSPAHPDQAYIHLVGVDPTYRGRGLGRSLYDRFFETARARQCQLVRCVTTPTNSASIQFHRKMGFTIEPGDTVAPGGVAVRSNYSGPGQDRVCFVKDLDA